jgi:hypothetical protein
MFIIGKQLLCARDFGNAAEDIADASQFFRLLSTSW